MSTNYWLQTILLCMSFGSILTAAWMWHYIAFFVMFSLLALFMAYIVRDVQRDNERKEKLRAMNQHAEQPAKNGSKVEV